MTDAEETSTAHHGISVERVAKLFPGVTWHPSETVWERAKVLYPHVDLMKVVVEYIQKNYRSNKAPDENQWLSWVAQAERQHEEARLRIEAEAKANERKPAWWHVAD